MYSKIDVINKEGEAIEEAVAWHAVGIVAEDGQSIGTGSAILWRQRPLTLTAGHVIEGSPDDDILFYFRPEGTMKRHRGAPAPSRCGIQNQGQNQDSWSLLLTEARLGGTRSGEVN